MNALTTLPTPEAREEWTKERIEVVKRQLCPSGITDAELAVFVEVCKRSGLDPFQKEIFCVPRKQNVGSKDNPKWIQKHEAQPAEAGMLARADRFPDFRGIKAAAVYSGDEISIDQDTVVHRFNPAQRKGNLIGAWAQAFREGRVYPVEYVTLEAYRQPTPQWTQKPDTMLVKCARAAALRRAYPNAFAGLYLREEMPAEEFEPVAAGQTVAKRGLDSIPKAALPEKASGLVVDVQPGETEEKATLRAKAEVAARQSKAPPDYTGVPMDELAAEAMRIEGLLQKNPKGRNRAEGQMMLAAIQAEVDKRRMELEPPPPSDSDIPFGVEG